ncbi:Dyp-type peroxidase [Pseudoglutamicibacter cumminsii]|uniref:Dyp-type peroxidase n=1 Tax=Pseudoglutamicibacter cumminsii TaxID=156979 RepID=UPI0019571CD8|nr:Dyp-type peroxidase [Pseudoglutamicibacter cumminsii]MBM7795720.1 dye decolorizing peroxidase [Pseudoglutamicibacter cumminsii]
MTRAEQDDQKGRGGVSRRSLLFGGAATVAGAAAVVGVDAFASNREDQARKEALAEADVIQGVKKLPFYGEHQAGVEMYPQAHQTLVGLTLKKKTDRDGLYRLLNILTDDAARLTQGTGALADTEPELAFYPSRLTVTFGFGSETVKRINPDPKAMPDWLKPLPKYKRDTLKPEWTGGDFLIQVAADDPVTVAHATRMLLKDSRHFMDVAWVQQGFRRAYGSQKHNHTQRNLFGQLDGTVNMAPETDDFASVVWEGPDKNPAWLDGGTSLVIRRIEMMLDKWDRLDRDGREASVGRRMASGAPLTGHKEHDEPDFEAKNAAGFPVIAEFAHIRRARSDNPHERIFRRVYNYDVHPSGTEVSDSGLIFTAFQHNPVTQYAPLQKRLDELDLLNEWITHIGSAVFAIPPGCKDGGFIGDTLFA